MRRHSEVTPGSLVYRGGAGPFGDPQASPFSSTQPIAEDAPYTASYGYGSEVTPDVVKVKPGKNATEVEVSCPDRRGLGFALARIMFAFGLNVVKGDFSIDGSWCFVVFHVRMGDERHDHTSPFWTTLKKRIEEECPDAAPQLIPHADGGAHFAQAGAESEAMAEGFSTSSGPSRFFMLQVCASDRLGMLNDTTLALWESEVNIHSAHITTSPSNQAIDLFMVSDMRGLLPEPSRVDAVRGRILAALGDASVRVSLSEAPEYMVEDEMQRRRRIAEAQAGGLLSVLVSPNGPSGSARAGGGGGAGSGGMDVPGMGHAKRQQGAAAGLSSSFEEKAALHAGGRQGRHRKQASADSLGGWGGGSHGNLMLLGARKGSTDRGGLVRSRGSNAPPPDLGLRVTFDNTTSRAHTLMQVTTKDRKGLLYDQLRTIKGCNLQVSFGKLIVKENGICYTDLFVQCPDGARLTDSRLQQELRRRMCRAMENPVLVEMTVPSEAEYARLLVTSPVDEDGRGRPRIMWEVTAALRELNVGVFKASVSSSDKLARLAESAEMSDEVYASAAGVSKAGGDFNVAGPASVGGGGSDDMLSTRPSSFSIGGIGGSSAALTHLSRTMSQTRQTDVHTFLLTDRDGEAIQSVQDCRRIINSVNLYLLGMKA